MPQFPIPANEAARLRALYDYEILDTPAEAAYDDLTALAAQLCQAPVAALSFMDAERQWFKANFGLQMQENARARSFCAHTIALGAFLEVTDAVADARFAANPAVAGAPGVRFYAGVPLMAPGELCVGTLCVLDVAPRQLAPLQRAALEKLARQAVAHLELRGARAAQASGMTLYRQTFQAAQVGLLLAEAASGVITDVNPALCQLLAMTSDQCIGRRFWQLAPLALIVPDENAWRTLCAAGRLRIARVDLPLGVGVPIHFGGHLVDGAAPAVVQCTLRDISRDLREAAARRSTELNYHGLLQSSLDAIVHMDGRGCVCEWNPAAERIFGRARAEVIGRALADLIVPPALREAHHQGFARHLQSGDSHILGQRIEVPALRADGTEFPVELTIVRHQSEGGPVFVATLRDISERQRAQSELRDSQTRFQNIISNVPGMVYQFRLNADGRQQFVFVSDGCREIFGVAPQIILDDASFIARRIHPDDRSDYNESCARTARTLKPWKWEGRVILDGGQTRWISTASRPRSQDDGGILWDGAVMDVSARRQAENERDRFFTLSLDMLAIFDGRGHFIRLNPAFEATLGWSESQMLAAPFMDWVHPEDYAVTQAAIAQLTGGATLEGLVNRYRCKDGTYRHLQWSAAEHGGLTYAAARDISDIKVAEAALRRANAELENRVVTRTDELRATNARLQLEIAEGQKAAARSAASARRLNNVLESISDAFISLDKKWRYIYINDEAERLLGRPRADMIGREIWAELPHLRGSVYQTQWQRAAQTGEPVKFEHYDQTRDIWFGVHTYPSDEGLAIYFQNINERRAAQDALEKAVRRADAANAAKSEFLSRMSHELRTPLSAILGFGQVLEHQELSELQAESVGYILKSGRHLLELVNEVLDIARVESGRLDLVLETLSACEMLSEVCALLRPLAQARAIEITRAPPSSCGCHTRADAQRLKQILINLLSNALKYNVEGGRVEASCESDGNRVRIAVRDSGIGIAPAELARLFEPFERGRAAHSGIEGTGLGLSLSRHLVEAMGGTLRAHSTPGSGSTFTLELPAANIAPVSRAPISRAPVSRGPLRVLCIADSTMLQILQAKLGARADLAVLRASTGASGLELARHHEPDLIVLGADAPALAAREVARRLQNSALTRHIPRLHLGAQLSDNAAEFWSKFERALEALR